MATEPATLYRDGLRLSDDKNITKGSEPHLSADSWVYYRYGYKPEEGRIFEMDLEYKKNKLESVDKFYPRYSSAGIPSTGIKTNAILTDAIPIMSMLGKGEGPASDIYTISHMDYTCIQGRPRYHTAEMLGSKVREIYNVLFNKMSIKSVTDKGHITVEHNGGLDPINNIFIKSPIHTLDCFFTRISVDNQFGNH